MIENAHSFVYALRGKDMTWTPLRVEGERVLCSSEFGDHIYFDKIVVKTILNSNTILKEMDERRKSKSLSAGNKI